MLFNNLLIIITVKQHQNLMAEYRSIKNICFFFIIYIYIYMHTKKKNRAQRTPYPSPLYPRTEDDCRGGEQNTADHSRTVALTDWENDGKLELSWKY